LEIANEEHKSLRRERMRELYNYEFEQNLKELDEKGLAIMDDDR
jgi:hypothetical protein